MPEMTPPMPDRESEHLATIQELLSIAKEKGVAEAIDEAKKLNNPHLLDDFHDALVKTRQSPPPQTSE